MPKALDLTNQRFGYLTALRRAPSKNARTYWDCVCDCGREKTIQTAHLTTGVTTTCGNAECPYHFNPFDLNAEKTESKQCILCGSTFLPNNYARVYCYECNPEGVGATVALRYKKRALKHLLVQYKGGKCERCGYDKCEGALHFHHNDPNEKEFSVAHINLNSNTVSIDSIYAEVDKCSLLCANCHAEEHYLEDINN